MRIVTRSAPLDLCASVGALTEILGFVVALDANIKHRHNEQVGLDTTVHVVTLGAFTIADRGMAHLLGEIAIVTGGAGIEDVLPGLHLPG